MEVALRRRLEGVVDITISQREQTTRVAFTDTPHAFSPGTFREAVGEAGVEVVEIAIEACGLLETKDGLRWLAAGQNRFVLEGEGAASGTDGEAVCVAGRLDEPAPDRLVIASPERLTP